MGYLLFLIPISVFSYFKTGMVRATLWAGVRMTVQLVLVGIYLEYIFRWDNPYVNVGWIVVMVGLSSQTVIKRAQLNPRLFLWPVFIALLFSLLTVDMYFLGVVIRLGDVFTARYFIPITGMILGNCIKTNVIAMNTLFKSLRRDVDFLHYSLAGGATLNEALAPFVRETLKIAFNPTIAGMAVMGLVSLPGMMTGQILGGSNPLVAIKYQIML